MSCVGESLLQSLPVQCQAGRQGGADEEWRELLLQDKGCNEKCGRQARLRTRMSELKSEQHENSSSRIVPVCFTQYYILRVLVAVVVVVVVVAEVLGSFAVLCFHRIPM
jgi:hypothetical protein